jgi:hypothetical protein
LSEIFGPDVVPAAPKGAKPLPKPPLKVTRVPVIEKRIAIGVELLALRAKCRRNNDYAALRRRHFPDLDPKIAIGAKRIAKVYSDRPDIYRRASWHALAELSLLPVEARKRFEARILACERVTARDVKRARGPSSGRDASSAAGHGSVTAR